MVLPTRRTWTRDSSSCHRAVSSDICATYESFSPRKRGEHESAWTGGVCNATGGVGVAFPRTGSASVVAPATTEIVRPPASLTTRWLPPSATKRSPAASTAMPYGKDRPDATVVIVPFGATTRRRPVKSERYRLPLGSTASPWGEIETLVAATPSELSAP